MLKSMNSITDKPGWKSKVRLSFGRLELTSDDVLSKIFDTSITEKWKARVLTRAMDFTPAMADYCIDELKYKAELYRKTGAVSTFHGDVVKGDNCIPVDLKRTFRTGITAIEDFSDRRTDWHPGSNETVLDLVYPSLYPLTYGLTRIIPDSILDLETCIMRSGHGETIPVPPATETVSASFKRWGPEQRLYSSKFQWLPCDVDISGESPRLVNCYFQLSNYLDLRAIPISIVSYINNLHPQRHANLYSIIENIIGKVIPLWNQTLSPLRDFVYRRRIALSPNEYLGKHSHRMKEAGDRFYFAEDFIDLTKPGLIHILDAGVFTKPETLKDPVNLKVDYGHRGIQVIVKLTNIHLTPENPKFSGENWNLQGQLVSLTDLLSNSILTRP